MKKEQAAKVFVLVETSSLEQVLLFFFYLFCFDWFSMACEKRSEILAKILIMH